NTTGGTSGSSYIYTGIADANNPSCALFIAPFILNPHNAHTMLAGGCQLWRSTNVKAVTPTWASIKATDAGGLISAIAVAPSDPDVMWVGHSNGDVFRHTSGTYVTPARTRVDAGGNA